MGSSTAGVGKTSQGQWCVASETCAFDAIGRPIYREIEPGEIVRLDDHGMSSRRFDTPAKEQAHCVFEHVYFANPASKIFGQTVHIVREKNGSATGPGSPGDRGLRDAMPDSGRSAALGFAKESCHSL